MSMLVCFIMLNVHAEFCYVWMSILLMSLCWMLMMIFDVLNVNIAEYGYAQFSRWVLLCWMSILLRVIMMSFVMLNADITEFCYAKFYLLCCVWLCLMFILSVVMLNAYTAKCLYAEIPYTECLCCLVSLYNVMLSNFSSS
jgi:hypothetical protein